MIRFSIISKENTITKLFVDFIFIFCLPQIIIGVLLAFFPSFGMLKIYVFLKNLFCIMIYALGCIILFVDIKNIKNISYKKYHILLYAYIVISLFIMSFYNDYSCSLISYITENIIYMIRDPFNEFNCDILCRAFKYLFTNNFYDN